MFSRFLRRPSATGPWLCHCNHYRPWLGRLLWGESLLLHGVKPYCSPGSTRPAPRADRTRPGCGSWPAWRSAFDCSKRLRRGRGPARRAIRPDQPACWARRSTPSKRLLRARDTLALQVPSTAASCPEARTSSGAGPRDDGRRPPPELREGGSLDPRPSRRGLCLPHRQNRWAARQTTAVTVGQT